jgi:hypothetical protein
MDSATPTFAKLLAQDCDLILPTTDDAVIAALHSYGVLFSKRSKKEEAVAARADLLAGVAWIHTNHASLSADLARASKKQ